MIPAPIAYVKAVAVKKLVVGLVSRAAGSPPVCANVWNNNHVYCDTWSLEILTYTNIHFCSVNPSVWSDEHCSS